MKNALHDHQRGEHLPHCSARVVEGAAGRVDPGGYYSRDLDSHVVKRTLHTQNAANRMTDGVLRVEERHEQLIELYHGIRYTDLVRRLLRVD